VGLVPLSHNGLLSHIGFLSFPFMAGRSGVISLPPGLPFYFMATTYINNILLKMQQNKFIIENNARLCYCCDSFHFFDINILTGIGRDAKQSFKVAFHIRRSLVQEQYI